AIGDDARAALTRAFSQAAAYDRATRVAVTSSPRLVAPLHPAALARRIHALHVGTSHATNQDRARKPARDVRAHDARTLEQHGARVRRRDSLDDGQVRRDR